MLLTRPPHRVLRPFVRTIWAMDARASAPLAEREGVLPTGLMHLVFRLSDAPLRIFDDVAQPGSRLIGHTVVGGARSRPYVRDISLPSASVGAQLYPGTSELLFKVPADELAERHTPLDELWGSTVDEIRDALIQSVSLEKKLELLESLLVKRLPRVRALHPAVAHALDRFNQTNDIGAVVKQTGYSHRSFINLFSRAVGLTPKLYCRLLRFQKVIELAAAHPAPVLSELALEVGYSDQPHFNRQFKEFAGIRPGEYLSLAPSSPNHVPLRAHPGGVQVRS